MEEEAEVENGLKSRGDEEEEGEEEEDGGMRRRRGRRRWLREAVGRLGSVELAWRE